MSRSNYNRSQVQSQSHKDRHGGRYQRLLIDLLGVLAMVALPWWAAVCIVVFASWRYAYYEGIIIGAILDLLYGSRYVYEIAGHHFMFPFTFLFFLIFMGLPIIKRRVRSYS